MMSQMGGSALTSLAGSSLGIKNPGDMYVSLLRTRTVEDAVIQRFGLMARYKKIRMVDTRKALEKHVAVAFGTKDGLIRIDVRDRDSRMAANIANGYVDEFKKQSANLAITEAAQRRLFFQQQLEEAKNNLANAEIAMKDTEQSTGVLQIDSQAKALIESAAGLRAQVVAKQVQLQGLRSFATEDNPEVALAERQLGALQTQLGQLGGAGGGAADPMIPKGQIPEAGMEYIRKFRDVKYYETIYDLIAKQYEAAKLDEARQGATIQIVDAAVPPDKNSSPRRSILIIVIGACGILAASLMTIFQELIMRARDNTEINYKLNALLTTLHFYC
jgi:capsule polysaccharide export protein KpsE/RkpR